MWRSAAETHSVHTSIEWSEELEYSSSEILGLDRLFWWFGGTSFYSEISETEDNLFVHHSWHCFLSKFGTIEVNHNYVLRKVLFWFTNCNMNLCSMEYFGKQ